MFGSKNREEARRIREAVDRKLAEQSRRSPAKLPWTDPKAKAARGKR